MNAIDKLNYLAELAIKGIERPLSTKAAAEYLGISRSAIYKLIKNNRIKHFKPNGKIVYFNRDDLEKYAFSNKKE